MLVSDVSLIGRRGDRRTQHMEQTVWTSILHIDEPQPRRVGAQRPFVPTRMPTPGKKPADRDPEFARRPQRREARRRLTDKAPGEPLRPSPPPNATFLTSCFNDLMKEERGSRGEFQ
jgi:hypothetical protein